MHTAKREKVVSVFRILVITTGMWLAVLSHGPAANAQGPGGASGPKTIVGEIRNVDVPRSRVTIQESANAAGSPRKAVPETVVISVDAGTQISRGKRTITLSELRPQDRVLANYSVTPQGLRAVSIRAADLPGTTPTVPPPPSGR
ncbi:MAG: hypothetical protein DIJKHBIC_04105 [Thermoanaerobaculia bacterium]|nr:hypothetical protein [Thermoanaerobaculia bacterium]